MRKLSVGRQGVARESKIETIEHGVEHTVAKRGVLQIARHYDKIAVIADADLKGMTEVGIAQKLAHDFQMVRHPAIVVAEIRDEAALRLLQCFVPVDLAFARALG